MFNLFKNFILCFIFLFGICAHCQVDPDFIRIGTASISGVYYTTGNAVCRFLKKESYSDDKTNIFCSVQSTPGAMYNLNALKNNDLEVAIAQSDWEYHVLNSSGVFKNTKPMSDLRSIFTTHKEAFTIMVKDSSGIEEFEDIKGKIVNIGAPGTGVRGTIEDIMKAKNWTVKDFKLATELSSSEQAQALCDGKIDVMLNVIGHPNGLFQEASATCNTKFVSLDKKTLNDLLDKYEYYSYYEIPTEHYMVDQDLVPTIAVRSTFYAKSDLPDADVYKIVESVFNNFSTFKSIHPAFARLTKNDLVPRDSMATIHSGAAAYYRKVGLL